jgi:ubiquinone/menaquinone biosynthesis C-methylase UbiE
MHQKLLPLLACPRTGHALGLQQPVLDSSGAIASGLLVNLHNPSITYPIINGVPRFVPQTGSASVHSFGDQWNHFNFDKFSRHFAHHTIANTFGSYTWFKGKTVVDAGAGSGMQTRWLAENGASHVIALELSHSVDGIISSNLAHLPNVDVIQCSIDAIPLKTDAITGLVMCNNVIQHTPSVAKTLAELWRITAPGAELAFNCYTRNDSSLPQRLRFKLYSCVRSLVSRLPFGLRMAYAHLMSALRFIPGLGWALEKADLLRRGEVPPGSAHRLRQLYRAGVLNTFDYFGAHAYQHHHTFQELIRMGQSLRPAAIPVNAQQFFTAPQPIGILLRLSRQGAKSGLPSRQTPAIIKAVKRAAKPRRKQK